MPLNDGDFVGVVSVKVASSSQNVSVPFRFRDGLATLQYLVVVSSKSRLEGRIDQIPIPCLGVFQSCLRVRINQISIPCFTVFQSNLEVRINRNLAPLMIRLQDL